MSSKITFILFFFFCSLSEIIRAKTELPAIFGNHMVLQRDKPVPVWGWSEDGQEVRVSFGGKTATGKAGKDGRWEVRLPAMKANDPGRELSIEGTEQIIIKDVLVGEVSVCPGQSNLEWPVTGALNPNEERQAANHPKIRHSKDPKLPSDSQHTNYTTN